MIYHESCKKVQQSNEFTFKEWMKPQLWGTQTFLYSAFVYFFFIEYIFVLPRISGTEKFVQMTAFYKLWRVQKFSIFFCNCEQNKDIDDRVWEPVLLRAWNEYSAPEKLNNPFPIKMGKRLERWIILRQGVKKKLEKRIVFVL